MLGCLLPLHLKERLRVEEDIAIRGSTHQQVVLAKVGEQPCEEAQEEPPTAGAGDIFAQQVEVSQKTGEVAGFLCHRRIPCPVGKWLV